MVKLEKIELNIKGLNLAYEKGDRDQLLSIAKEIFPPKKFEQLLIAENCYSGLSWNSNLNRLFEENPVEPITRFNLILGINAPIMRMHQTLSFLEYLTAQDEIDFANEVVESLKDIDSGRTKDTRSLGHRKILDYYAGKADFTNFSKTLKLCEPAKERRNLDRIKWNFIANYAESNNLEDTLKIVKHKVFGKRFIFGALEPMTKKVSYRSMKNTLDSHEFLKELDSPTKIQLIAETFYENSKTKYNLKDFDEIFEQIFNLDPKIRHGDYKLRDYLLMQIGRNLNERDLVMKCKKAIKNPRIKRELVVPGK